MRKPYHPDLFSSVPWEHALDFEGDFRVLVDHVSQHFGEADRSCVDRWLIIYDRARSMGLNVPSVLDLGCSSGLFSVLARLSLSNDVVAVDDGSALTAGYDGRSVLLGLADIASQLGVTDIEAVNEDVVTFVNQASQTGRSWDLTLCLGLLHHLVRGYADLPTSTRLSDHDFDTFLRYLARCTRKALWIEVDETRVGPARAFFDRITNVTGLRGESVGLSCSGQGRPRQLFCFESN